MNVRSSSRRGFTLVELLVVIAIIGVLIALLLPAVQAAREAARRTQCINNLKQLGLGEQNYLSTYKVFPSGGWGYSWNGDPNQGVGKSQPGAWGFSLLPFIEQEQLWEMGASDAPAARLAANAKRIGTPLAGYYCPSRRLPKVYPVTVPIWFVLQPLESDPTPYAARTDYAACSHDIAHGGFQIGPPNSTVGNIPAGQPGAYGWPNPNNFNGISFPRSEISVHDILDGTSNTYMIGEKFINPDVVETGGPDLGDDQNCYSGDERDVHRDAVAGPFRDRRGFTDTWSFGGPHASGLNMLFCDGSVKVINYRIALRIHRLLANRRDGQPIPAGSY